MKIAETISELSTCSSLKVGTVIVRDKRIISTGYNGVVSGENHCNSINWENQKEHSEWSQEHEIHSEMNAILWAAKEGLQIDNATLFTTVSPCPNCIKHILQTGIKSIIYLTKYHRTSDDQHQKDITRCEKKSVRYKQYDSSI